MHGRHAGVARGAGVAEGTGRRRLHHVTMRQEPSARAMFRGESSLPPALAHVRGPLRTHENPELWIGQLAQIHDAVPHRAELHARCPATPYRPTRRRRCSRRGRLEPAIRRRWRPVDSEGARRRVRPRQMAWGRDADARCPPPSGTVGDGHQRHAIENDARVRIVARGTHGRARCAGIATARASAAASHSERAEQAVRPPRATSRVARRATALCRYARFLDCGLRPPLGMTRRA